MQGVLIAHHPVTTLASGHEVTIVAHTLEGTSDGPSVAIVSGLHGDELFTAEFCRYALRRLTEGRDALRGRVTLVPMASPPSFEWGTRTTPHDGGNMNRLFPGSARGSLTEQLTDVLVEKVVRGSDLVLDYHAEPDAMNIRCTYGRAGDSPYGASVLETAIASGSPVVYAAPRAPGTLAGHAEQLGIPALVPELGGPLPDEAHHLAYGWAELRNVLRHVGVLPGAPTSAPRQWIVHEVGYVRPRAGGLFHPEVGFDALTAVLPRDTVLGRVISPYTFEELDVLRAPFEQNVMMVVRGRVSKVHPGDAAYIIGNGVTAELREASSGQSNASSVVSTARGV